MANTSDPEIAQTYNDILNCNTNLNWLLLRYEGKSTLKVGATGSGGLRELCEQLKDDEVAYAYLKMNLSNEDSSEDVNKFVLFSWVGTSVGALSKAKVSVHREQVRSVISKFDLEIGIENKDELEEERLISMLARANRK